MYILDQWPAIDWYKYYCIWERLSEDMLHVAEIVGVKESFIGKAMQTKPLEKTNQQQQRLRVHRRFYTSLVLQELVREVPIGHVAYKYGASKGLLQSLQSAAGTFSGMVTVFCNKLGWKNLEVLLSQFQSRLTFGIERELVDLVKITLLNGCRARVLFNAGFHNLGALATANPLEVEKVLRNAFPYKMKNGNEEELVVNWCAKLRKGMTEGDAAREIVQEAKKILCDELNIPIFAIETHINGKQAVPAKGIDVNQVLRLNRKAVNKNEIEQVSSNAKQPKLNEEQQSEIQDKRCTNVLSTKNDKTNEDRASQLSSRGMDFSGGTISNTSFNMDFSLNTLAQLDAVFEVNESLTNQHQIKGTDDNKENQLSSLALKSTETNNMIQQSVQQQLTVDESMSVTFSFKELSVLHTTTCSESGLTVIDIAANEILLETFLEECKEQKMIAFSVAAEQTVPSNGIGASLIKPCNKLVGIPIPMTNEQVLGVAFSWGEMDTFYLSLCESFDTTSSKRILDMSLVGSSPLVSLDIRLKALESLFKQSNCFVAYDVKKHAKLLMSACQVDIQSQVLDPKVADWLLDPDMREKTLNHMMMKYLPAQPKLAEGVDGCETTLCTVACHSPFPYLKSCAECVIADMLMDSMDTLLRDEGFITAFEKVEMPIAMVLAKIEVNGIGFSITGCEKLRDQLQQHLYDLEQEGYKHAGRTFSLTSPEDVSTVLFNELKLPSFQNSDRSGLRSLGGKRRGRQRVQHLSTSKDILEKIKPFHPLPGVVLEWRRVSSTMSRTLFPLFKASVSHSNLAASNRIHPFCQIHTATGRVSISDPNLQNVPKEYPVGLHRVSNSTQQTLLNSLLPEFDACGSQAEIETEGIKTVCMRDVFEPFPGAVFVAADYSQLELRLLAHLSGDKKLCNFLNHGGDAFRMIAGEWLSIDASNVTDIQRQHTKQMCYGMVYGIGAKALGEQLGVSEDEAYKFMDSFKSKYPQLKKFISTTISECRDKGYIETILGRKRFLPQINSPDLNKRAHAERQAVNSTIQGSAADLVKTAMIKVENELNKSGLVTCLSKLTHLSDVDFGCRREKVALLVLQLHDELVYEVHVNVASDVVGILKREMENAIQLSVIFPVKIKTGPSWGQLELLDF